MTAPVRTITEEDRARAAARRCLAALQAALPTDPRSTPPAAPAAVVALKEAA